MGAEPSQPTTTGVGPAQAPLLAYPPVETVASAGSAWAWLLAKLDRGAGQVSSIREYHYALDTACTDPDPDRSWVPPRRGRTGEHRGTPR